MPADANGIEAPDHNPTEIIQDLSTAVLDGRYLWLGSDEYTHIERLTRLDSGGFGNHCRYDLSEIFKLPEGASQEIDIEGLDVVDNYIWIVGSHSTKRIKPEPGEDSAQDIIKKLAKVKIERNRYLLARAPLTPARSKSGPEPASRLSKKSNGKDKTFKAAALDLGSKTSPLVSLLAKDKHLRKFVGIPSKENGLDIEGLAVSSDRVWLGLRGPVLRGWAVVIELHLKVEKSGKLKLGNLPGSKDRYRKHFLDLGGLGIRSLTRDGNDLLVLAGPTMALDGPSAIHRWPNALATEGCQVLTEAELPVLLRLPYGKDIDHAEGTALLKDGKGKPDLMVVYDSPAPSRIKEKGLSVDADLFALV
ncbi:MAG: DUF3616 domain-containing protein [Pseudomonadota bacterium]